MQAWNGASIEEALTWKNSEQRTNVQNGFVIKQSVSRVGPERDIYLYRLNNVSTCPVSAMSLLSVMHYNMLDIGHIIQAGEASSLYLFHHPDNPKKPLTAKSIKRQIIKALAKMDIHVELYEVQSLLDATSARITRESYNTKVHEPHCAILSLLPCSCTKFYHPCQVIKATIEPNKGAFCHVITDHPLSLPQPLQQAPQPFAKPSLPLPGCWPMNCF